MLLRKHEGKPRQDYAAIVDYRWIKSEEKSFSGRTFEEHGINASEGLSVMIIKSVQLLKINPKHDQRIIDTKEAEVKEQEII